MNFIKTIFSKIKTSYFKSLRGEENFWIVLFGWGVFFYVIFGVSEYSLYKYHFLTHDKNPILIFEYIWPLILAMVGTFGIIIIFIYLFFIIFLIFKSSKKRISYISISIIASIYFVSTHCIISIVALPSSIEFIADSAEINVPFAWLYKVVGIMTVILTFIYIFVKTKKILPTQKYRNVESEKIINTNKKRKNLKKLFISSVFIIVLSTVTALTISSINKDKPKKYTPPVSVPFDLTKNGNKTEVMVNIKEYHGYSFELQFFFDNPRITLYDKALNSVNTNVYISWILLFVDAPISFVREKFGKEYTEEELGEMLKDMHRVTKLVGGRIPSEPGNPYSKWIDYPGITTPVHLKLIKMGKEENVIFDETIEEQKNLFCSGNSCSKKIGAMGLKPGLYKFIIQSLKDSPEFIGTETHLRIARPGGK